MSVVKKLAGQTAIYGLSSIVGRLLNYFLVPLHTSEQYGFEKADYGIISEYYAFVAFFIVLLTFGMETTFFRFVNRSEDQERTFNLATSVVMVLSGVFLVTILLTSQSIANWMGYPDQRNFVMWFGAILAVDATTSMFLAKLRHQNKAKKFALAHLSSIGVNILLNLIFILGFYDTSDPSASIGIGFVFLANLLSSFVKPIVLFKEVSSYRFVWDKAVTKAMLIFSFPLAIAGFGGIINETIDRILIKRMLMGDGSPEQLEYAQSQVGIYSANYKISILITLFIQAFRYAAEPFFFAQEKDKNRDKTYSKIMTWFVIVVSLMFLVIASNLEIFKWFIPNETYHEGLKVVPILLLANVCLGIYYNQSIWYKLANKTQYGAYISIGGAIVTIGLNLALIPVLGYMGSAWATLVCYFAMMVASHIFGQRIYPIKYNLRKVFLYLFTALGLYFLGLLLTFDSFWLTFVIHGILILLFVGLIVVMEQPLKTLRKN